MCYVEGLNFFPPVIHLSQQCAISILAHTHTHTLSAFKAFVGKLMSFSATKKTTPIIRLSVCHVPHLDLVGSLKLKCVIFCVKILSFMIDMLEPPSDLPYLFVL